MWHDTKTSRHLTMACSVALMMVAGAGAAIAGGHHHHHGGGNDAAMSFGPVHGPGSSHNPTVSHPPKIHKPTTQVGNAQPNPGPDYVYRGKDGKLHHSSDGRTAYGTQVRVHGPNGTRCYKYIPGRNRHCY